jgi:hypothetical protein
VPSTIVQNPPEHPGKICTNKTSVSFPPSAGAKYRQELQYGSDEGGLLDASQHRRGP